MVERSVTIACYTAVELVVKVGLAVVLSRARCLRLWLWV